MPYISRVLFVLVLTALAGCGSVRNPNEDPQSTVDKRVIGMNVGDFFQRYGKPAWRDEAKDGSLTFDWQSELAKTPAGPLAPEESLCRLRIQVNPGGRIVGAPIMRDGRGRRHVSLCVDLFGVT